MDGRRQMSRRYLDWLHKWNGGDHKYLLWDLHSSHRSDQVKEHSRTCEVTLQFIPAGMTDHWQPLDYRIFGELKQRAKARFDAYFGKCLADGRQPNYSMIDIAH